jgi:radical SAM protein with 4Fe4S-binding SPASM domain
MTASNIPRPRIIAFEVTQRCPLNCRHCRAAASQEKSDYLSTEQCKSILKGVADFHKCVVILTGGEPMERPDVFELTEYGRSLGLRMVMATCGAHLDTHTVDKLKEAGILAFSFSLDAATSQGHDAFRQTPGAWDRVMNAVELSKQAGIRFQINTTVTKKNLGQVKAIADLSVKLGAYCFNPFILVPVGRADAIRDLILPKDEYEQLLHELAIIRQTSPIEVRVTCGPQFARVARQDGIDDAEKVSGCLAATGFAFISHRGDVQTCGFLDISAGNLVENDFDFGKIWTESDYLNQLRDPKQYKGMCGVCAYQSSCRGCRARALAMSGDVLAQDPICKLAPEDKQI